MLDCPHVYALPSANWHFMKAFLMTGENKSVFYVVILNKSSVNRGDSVYVQGICC
jgi:hypothetical protein